MSNKDYPNIETTWMHINDFDKEIIEAVLPVKVHISQFGDCGSIWEEYHQENRPCPHPHVIIKNPEPQVFSTLEMLKIGYVLTSNDYSEDLRTFNWREDELCIDRNDYSRDYRELYEQPDRNKEVGKTNETLRCLH
jgi:hypothetical protein